MDKMRMLSIYMTIITVMNFSTLNSFILYIKIDALGLVLVLAYIQKAHEPIQCNLGWGESEFISLTIGAAFSAQVSWNMEKV